MKNILFVSHDANRAGAQILLLRFLKLLKNHPDFTFSILLKDGGVLYEEFAALGNTYILNQTNPIGRKQRIKQKIKQLIGKTAQVATPLSILSAQSFDLIVCNTVTNGDILPQLSAFKCPIYTYVHELEMGFEMYTIPAYLTNVLTMTDRFIACAASVKNHLIQQCNISDDAVKILPSLLPEIALQYKENPTTIQALKTRYEIPANAFLIGGMGTVDLRKGVDVFMQIANALQQQEDIYFMWVGGEATQTDFKLFNIDKKRLGLSNMIFQSSVSNALDYMAIFDVFFVSSREDPYPLVVLEAALLQKPILCFDKAGGAQDFVETDSGAVLPYLAIHETALKIVELKENVEQRKQLGISARKKVLDRHNQEKAFKTFVEILS